MNTSGGEYSLRLICAPEHIEDVCRYARKGGDLDAAGSGCWEGEYGWCLGEVIHGHMHMPVLQVLAKGTTSPAWKEHKALSGSIPQGNVE